MFKEMFLDPKEREERAMNLLYYALRRNGGLIWPSVYVSLFFMKRDSLEPYAQAFFVVVGIVLFAISMWCMIWGHYHLKDNKKANEEYFYGVQDAFGKLAAKIDQAGVRSGMSAEVENMRVSIAELACRLHIDTGMSYDGNLNTRSDDDSAL